MKTIYKKYGVNGFIIKWSHIYEKWQVCYQNRPLEEFNDLDKAKLWASENNISIKK
ncbi:hypothetical protein FACS189456_3640 [Bacteroidia bacterium]|nr:hypothetical protein FACS189456_3640 [Bacteroidia bacterium]